ncbi:helix-turn-helix domain-containing protein [Photobacterium angustum]|uniref:AraC family transcriptional regulator n=1 Tax=Photobacterium angustum TaxID=661 RepID=A0ABX5H634_PHOAN|nr:AraC family transcriptional regulator [Photobacterium angustum]PSX10948.1 AraC family transcriptional regulator [Photobacterium angustum]
MEDKRLILKHFESHKSEREIHSHSYLHLVYVHKGCQILYTDQHSLLSMPGTLVCVPSNTPHRADFLEKSQISLLRLPSNFNLNINEICILKVSPFVTQLFNLWESKLFKPSLFDEYVDVLIDQCSRCVPLVNPLIASGSMDRRLFFIIEALSDKPNIKMSISKLSEQTGASVRTLNRLFLSHFKASFKDIRNKVVMERAEQMMKKGISVTDIAFELEYSSISAFSTAFSKYQKQKY